MHKLFHKLAITAVLSIGLSSSLMANDDLLSLATNGEVVSSVEAVNTTDAIKLSDTQMSDVRGGATIYNSYRGIGSTYYYANIRAVTQPVTTKSAIMARAFGNRAWGLWSN